MDAQTHVFKDQQVVIQGAHLIRRKSTFDGMAISKQSGSFEFSGKGSQQAFDIGLEITNVKVFRAIMTRGANRY